MLIHFKFVIISPYFGLSLMEVSMYNKYINTFIYIHIYIYINISIYMFMFSHDIYRYLL